MKIKVLVIKSLAYSGTTWTTMLLASHAKAFALGAGDRVFQLTKNDANNACFVHGGSCSFWPSFLENFQPRKNFLLQLSEYSGKNIFVINNPSPAAIASNLEHPDIDKIMVKQVRDGRATLYSWMRHHPHRYGEFYDAVRAWLFPAWKRLYNLKFGDNDQELLIRYEDVVNDWKKEVDKVGRLLGIEYENDAVQYWKYSHHLPNGNTGVIDVLRRLSGEEGLRHHLKDQYDEVLQSTLKEPDKPHLDESWKNNLSDIDLAAYDFIVGKLHESFGYKRDDIKSETMDEFRKHYKVPLSADEAISQIPSFSRKKQLRYRLIDDVKREVAYLVNKLRHIISNNK